VGERRRAFTGAPWESQVGYCRAVRVGDRIVVSGTAPVAEAGGVHAPGDGEAQARRCIELIGRALAELDAGLEHVVRTRMFVTDVTRWEEFGRAHAAAFGDHPPATTMVQVAALIDAQMLIEIEAEAIVP
jgi:enamine deaminase RidA (YjgF/YER057c/UK114 family)